MEEWGVVICHFSGNEQRNEGCGNMKERAGPHFMKLNQIPLRPLQPYPLQYQPLTSILLPMTKKVLQTMKIGVVIIVTNSSTLQLLIRNTITFQSNVPN